MKKLNFEKTLRIASLISLFYLLLLLTIIAYNSGNGRYEFKADSPAILDTKTGKIFIIKDGQMHELGK